ncbi:MAG: hypothetical protein ACK4NA_01365 [Alphaproteobacteria bacterium]
MTVVGQENEGLHLGQAIERAVSFLRSARKQGACAHPAVPISFCPMWISGGINMSDRNRLTRRDVFLAVGTVAATGALLGVAPRRASAATFSNADRRCATCDYWGGPRTITADKSRIETPDGATGICGNPKSPLHSKPTRADQVFNNGWMKWQALS